MKGGRESKSCRIQFVSAESVLVLSDHLGQDIHNSSSSSPSALLDAHMVLICITTLRVVLKNFM